jgi:acyl-CoA dehydrogenase
LVLDHRLGAADPFTLPDAGCEDAVAARLLGEESVSLSEVTSLLAA